MNTAPILPDTLASSVIAVPPLARRADHTLCPEQNLRQIRHLESGGVTTLLYGGNALLYHVALSEYDELLGMIADSAADQTLVIPSVGPAFGAMMDQADILRRFDFPTAMILPTRDVSTSPGVELAVRRFVERFDRPAVLYIKHDGFVDVATVKRLADDNFLSWIKYAVVRQDTRHDDYLRQLIDAVGPSKIVSGIGEQPAITHLRDFGLVGFTSGCVCVAPQLSMQMLRAIQSEAWEQAEQIRETFRPLEDLRNSIHPVRVLHAAVAAAGIAQTGPISPLLCEVELADQAPITTAAQQLLSNNRQPA